MTENLFWSIYDPCCFSLIPWICLKIWFRYTLYLTQTDLGVQNWIKNELGNFNHDCACNTSKRILIHLQIVFFGPNSLNIGPRVDSSFDPLSILPYFQNTKSIFGFKAINCAYWIILSGSTSYKTEFFRPFLNCTNVQKRYDSA